MGCKGGDAIGWEARDDEGFTAYYLMNYLIEVKKEMLQGAKVKKVRLQGGR